MNPIKWLALIFVVWIGWITYKAGKTNSNVDKTFTDLNEAFGSFKEEDKH